MGTLGRRFDWNQKSKVRSINLVPPLRVFLTPRAPRWAPVLRPTPHHGPQNLAQLTCPWETWTKTCYHSALGLFINADITYLNINRGLSRLSPIRDYNTKAAANITDPSCQWQDHIPWLSIIHFIDSMTIIRLSTSNNNFTHERWTKFLI